MILDGRELSKEIKENIKSKVALLDKKPRIDFIYFENDKSAEIYFNRAKKSAENAGMIGALHNLNSNTSEKDFLTLIEYLNEEKETNGIMIQMPLPNHIDKQKVYETISADKDVDAISNISLGRIFLGESKLIPCTVKSVMALLKKTKIKIEGANAVVVGRSDIVGKPLAHLLLQESATVTITHSKTKNLREVCKRSDILVVAIGKAKFIDDSFVKEGAIVIDVGTNSVQGKITGDVDFDKVIDKASFVTPVPGGVGALTTTLLMKNACEAIEKYED